MTAVQNSKLTVGAILSSQQLIDKVSQLAKRKFDQVCTEYVCGLQEAVPVGKEMENRGVDVLISRRGTAELLRENLRIPVLALTSNPLDILVSLKQAVMFGKRILITAFGKQLSGMAALEEIFDVCIMQGFYHDNESLEQVIVSAKAKDVDVIIGGGVSMKFAHQYGIKGVELYISEGAVALAIEDALSVALLRRQEQEKSERYRCIIDSTSDAVLSVDRSGIITAMNKAARALLHIESSDRTDGHALSDYMPRANVRKILDTKQPLFDKLEKIKGEFFLSNHIPITLNAQVVGLVSTYRHTAHVIKAENEVRRNFAKGFVAKYTIEDLVHSSAAMRDVVRRARRYAASDSTILISGETGTGKEILAQSIHNMGSRAKGPFVSINCAALPDQLLESELFGHVEGSFTGSRKGGKIGLFELAHKGTIFLDEISSTPLNVQARLLRVLQEKKVMRIGGDGYIPVDVRVLAVSNKNLLEEVRSRRFREDLFFRLSVLVINMPPLRERIEDLPVIFHELMMRIADKCGTKPMTIPDQAIRQLMRYPWHGNIRQLENFIERLLLLSDSSFDMGLFQDLFQEIEAYSVAGLGKEQIAGPGGTGRAVSAQERDIQEILSDARFCKTKAARMLGISRTTLWRKMKNLEIDHQ
jgi:transcriptional regulator, propionate catabolism operon regulatory protein